MRRFAGTTAVAAALLAASAPCARSGERQIGEPRASTIYARIYDYANVPPPILHQAKANAAWIFRRAGIEVVWLRDPVRGATGKGTPLVPGSAEHKQVTTQLSVRIYPPKLSRQLGTARTVLGFALQPEGGTGFGTTAIAFYEKAELLAELGVASREMVLGLIIAHEMGHLLLGNNSHSGSGIMRVPWDRAMLKRATAGWLNFTPEEVQRIRERLVERERKATQEMVESEER